MQGHKVGHSHPFMSARPDRVTVLLVSHIGVYLVFEAWVVRSSPVQQDVAQPRQVRKEATVGTRFCVTQGSLTSFCMVRL